MRRLVFHTTVMVHHLFVSYFSFLHLDFSNTVEKSVLNMDRFRYRFLTGWNFKIQTTYFIVCVIEDLLAIYQVTTPDIKKKIRTFKSFIFTSFVFPLSMFVTVMFWTLFAINRELVYPTAADTVFPSWFNHAMHTNITVVIMLEMFMSYHWYHKRKIAIIVLNAFMFIYVCCLLVTYLIHGHWLYPIFGTLDWSQRILFYLVTHILMMTIYMIGEVLNKIIWEKRIKRKSADKRQEGQTSANQLGTTS